MRSKRIKPIAKHADQIQQQAVQVYVTAQQALVDAELQLEQLLGYRNEYNANRVNTGVSARQLIDFQLFLDKLNRSIEHAKLVIEQKKHQCEQQKLNWLKTRSRSKALDAVIEKYKMQEAKKAQSIEQKEQDEYASRISQKKS